MDMASSRPRILFLDAYDSFSNNITALLTTLLDVDVFVLPIDSPLLDPKSPDFQKRWLHELSHYDAVVCGPGPGSPDNAADVGLMRHVWPLGDADSLPVLGICLGFQSLIAHCGGTVKRLQRGLHGMVRDVLHHEEQQVNQKTRAVSPTDDIFNGVQSFKATLYHSLCGDIGQHAIPPNEWNDARWDALPTCPDAVPLAWVEEEREDGVERVLMAVKHRTKPFWGLQYHPESVCTETEGNQVIVNWFSRAQSWNKARGRVARSGNVLARNATKPSLLSQLSPSARSSLGWWEGEYAHPEYHHTMIPLPHGVRVPDVVEALALEDTERLILDSANAASATARADVRGRYSIIAADLDQALRVEHRVGDGYATVKVGGGKLRRGMETQVSLLGYGGTIWSLVAMLHEERQLNTLGSAPEIPFLGGFMGYVTYEQGLEDIGVSLKDRSSRPRPDLCLVWVTKSVVIDHVLGVVYVQQLRPQTSAEDADTWVEDTTVRLLSSRQFHGSSPLGQTGPGSRQPETPQHPSNSSTSIQTPLPDDYETKVALCQDFIAAGDSYELCLTDQTKIIRPLSDDLMTSAPRSKGSRHQEALASVPSSWELFKSLRARQPAPFASYLRLGGATLVSASPERFLQYDRDGRCSMRPMKGTVRKSEEGQEGGCATLAEAERILHVPKEEAENLMIVDLVRHDLHGICGPGNVTVPHLLKVEEYQSVFQMITVVEGQLPKSEPQQQKYTGLDVLAASLPPGSMTGAPKKRSCEILQHIEAGSSERSLYSGVVGYMCVTGRGDWSVTIRSLFRWDDEQMAVEPVVDEGRRGSGSEDDVERFETWHIGAGGAVTILSTPEGEREEMFTKLAGPLRVFADSG